LEDCLEQKKHSNYLGEDMDYETKYAQLLTILNEIFDLKYAEYLAGWDQQTYMPPGGSLGRGKLAGTLRRLIHDRITSPQVGQLLADLESYPTTLDSDSNEARLIRVTKRLYEKSTKVPSALVSEIAQVTSEAHVIWERAREASDFSHFEPYLSRIVDLRRQYSGCFPYDHVYDPLLDDYEPGLKTADLQRFFSALRTQQVDLIQAISEQTQVDDSFLHQDFDEKRQWDFGVEVISRFGYDWNRGRQDQAAHPFTVRISQGDVRITTRFYPDYFSSAFFSTTHEFGHAIYELGVAEDLDRTPMGEGASMALHESQSRLYENLIGRSIDFWTYYYPRLQEYFPNQLGNVKLENFYKGINKVEPSLIRVEADEATYNLHIMLRLELEIALMEGSLEVKELQEAWNARMHDYLGISPPDDAQGVLQDVHWSAGYIGYFPTYALGNLVSAQLWECLLNENPEIPEQIRRGEFNTLREWMAEKVHRHGAKFEPEELVERITGSRIDPAPYMRYLNRKYSEIYQL
jgi:carboxypeptidase Taq